MPEGLGWRIVMVAVLAGILVSIVLGFVFLGWFQGGSSSLDPNCTPPPGKVCTG